MTCTHTTYYYLDLECLPKTQLSRVVLLGDRTFEKWGLLEGPKITGERGKMSLKETVGSWPSPYLFLLAQDVSGFTLPWAPSMMHGFTTGPKHDHGLEPPEL
jgi:hypothetical protein